MAFIHEEQREIHAKIVYAGPGGARACTRFIHGRLDPALLGAVVHERRGADELEGFEFAPAARLGAVGYRTHLHVFSADNDAPGPAAQRLLMRRADALVFVADGRRPRLAVNAERFAVLGDVAASFGDELTAIPLVVAVDHRSADAIDDRTLRDALGVGDEVPVIPVTVSSGAAVLETIKQATRLVLDRLRGVTPPGPRATPDR
jgi:hypothetical protein